MTTRLGRQVVVKVLPPETGAAVNVERFEREIQLAARLQHPHILPLLTAAGSGDLLNYVMPYISGESLRVRLSREGELPVLQGIRRGRWDWYEGRGDRAKALAAYGRFVDMWKDADPVLQPEVRDVRGRMAKLAGEAPR